MAEPPAKRARTEEDEAAEAPVEKEKDAAPDKRAALKDGIQFEACETTLNVVNTMGGRILMALTDGGMQFLFAGARADTGMMAGRYMFEAKVVEAVVPSEEAKGRGKAPTPRQLVRVGFSTARSTLLLGEGEGGVCFDSEGLFHSNGEKSATGSRIGRDQVVGVLLNLDQKSENKDTVSLFLNGVRASQPQPLPESLKGKPLFPHVLYRNVTLQVHFGPAPLKPLPFKCRMLQDAAHKDCVLAKFPQPKDGKHEVIFPVGMPDEGTFAEVDDFIQKNPGYVELSDRMVVDWATKSGVYRAKERPWGNGSNDKPIFYFGLHGIDDGSVQRSMYSLAALTPRNYVVLEVKSNLMAAERKRYAETFRKSYFKRVARITVGEPPESFKTITRQLILKDKTAKAQAEWEERKIELEKQRSIAARKKQIEAQRKLIEDQNAAAAAAASRPDGAEVKPEVSSDEVKHEEGKEEIKEEPKEEKPEADSKPKEEEIADEPMPEVTLTKEEEKAWFATGSTPDIVVQVLNQSFPQFTLPEKPDGFDEIRYEWHTEEESRDYLKKWIIMKKRITRVEDLQPSEWFGIKLSEWQKVMEDWRGKQDSWKMASAMQANKSEYDDGSDRGDVVVDDKDGPSTDIFSLEDVCNIGNGEPLFAYFEFEDWALLTLRFELFLLMQGFKRDVGDPDRVGIHESHLMFYYSRYFRKQLNPKLYNRETVLELVEMVKDTVVVEAETAIFSTPIKDETDTLDVFLKLTEEGRRERQRRIDAGDDKMRLSFSLLKQQQDLHQRQQEQLRMQQMGMHHGMHGQPMMGGKGMPQGRGPVSLAPVGGKHPGGCKGGKGWQRTSGFGR